MTVSELNTIIQDYSKKMKQERKNRVMQAYYTAYFYAKSQSKGGIKKSDIESITETKQSNKQMTEEAIFAAIKNLNQQFGGEG
jgi:hypothetical protein